MSTPWHQFICSQNQAPIAYCDIDAILAFTEQKLSPDLWAAAMAFNNPKRQREYLAVRALLQMLAPTSVSILYDPNRKPYPEQSFEWIGQEEQCFKDVKHINFSHTVHKIALIGHTTKSVGIDIEHWHPRVEKVKHKFLSSSELQLPYANDCTWLTIFWAAKEAAYKCWGKKEIPFASQLLLGKELPSIDNKVGGNIPMQLLTDEGVFDLSVQYLAIDTQTFMAWTTHHFSTPQ